MVQPANLDASKQNADETPEITDVAAAKPLVIPPTRIPATTNHLAVRGGGEISPELAELEALGMEVLKANLMQLGVKCGGTLRERAERMLKVKGLSSDQIPKYLRAKKQRKRKQKD